MVQYFKDRNKLHEGGPQLAVGSIRKDVQLYHNIPPQGVGHPYYCQERTAPDLRKTALLTIKLNKNELYYG